jgi:SAM-dependent methyltransferase
MQNEKRMYADLAWLWPILSPKEDYVHESEFIAGALKQHSLIRPRTLLHLGCGAGHNDYTLKQHFEVAGVDLSPHMLELARGLNPEVRYVEGDMRAVRLGMEFDAVIILDSIAYMLTEEALREALATAHLHLRPGGAFLSVVELDPTTFVQNKTSAWTRARGDVELTFIENYYDPDPHDSTYECTFLFLIREAGRLRIETDSHLAGIFPMETWRSSLEGAGFDVLELEYRAQGEHEAALPVLLGLKPEA